MPTPLTPEQQARQRIDRMLEAAGWQVQSRERMNRLAAEGVAVCEFPTATGPDVESVAARLANLADELTEAEATRLGEPTGGATCRDLAHSLLDAADPDAAIARAQAAIDSFRAYVEEHRDEIAALQLSYARPYGQQALTLRDIRELCEQIEQPPHTWTTASLWEAYAQLNRDRVRGMRAEQIGLSLTAASEDFQYGELRDRDGWIAAYRLFDAQLAAALEEMNAALRV